ncbi:zinc-binding dehydrogenase [Chryseobacterium sp. Leaf313]|uniref:zinc-binding dehydrogenase n=1 Tax=Chryseobacterium sp. Leaf313 TaxID=2876563 RepID=UPI001E3DDDA7|nr:zinc-binding dehydrogenase [Chryseobacterium sp. Leaf313]
MSGPPTPAFSAEFNLPWYVKLATFFLSSKVRRTAEKQNIDYKFLFMKVNGYKLAKINGLVDAGKIIPVIDKVFPFAQTNEALKYVENGRAKGKVVIKMI